MIKRVTAIFIALIISFLLVALLIDPLFNQASMFSNPWPQFVDRFTETLNQLVQQSVTVVRSYLSDMSLQAALVVALNIIWLPGIVKLLFDHFDFVRPWGLKLFPEREKMSVNQKNS